MATKKKVYATHVTTPAGKRVYIKGKDKEDLDRKVFEAKVALNAGVDITCDQTFRDYGETWLRVYKTPPKVRESSFIIYKNNLEKHLIPFFGDMKLRDIKSMHVQMFLGTLSGLSRSVQTKCLQMLRAIMRSAEDNGLIVKSPVRSDDRPSGETPPEEEPLTDEQAKELLAAVSGTRAYTFCLIALSTGLRRGEILGLMWEDIDLDAGAIMVTHNKAYLANSNDAPVTTMLKTDSSRRTIHISGLLLSHLRDLRATSESPFVICMDNGKSLTKASYRALWKVVDNRTYGPRCGVLSFRCHPHQLRHTFITQLFESGMDLKQVQYLAGHATPDMTLRVYTHFRQRSRARETAQQTQAAVSYLDQCISRPPTADNASQNQPKPAYGFC